MEELVQKLKAYFEKSKEQDNPFIASSYLHAMKELEDCFKEIKPQLFEKLKLEVGQKFEDENVIISKLEKDTYNYSNIFEYRKAEKELKDIETKFKSSATKKSTPYYKINKKK